MMKVRTRFAPSPTGFMHIGNLRTCLYAYLYAKKFDGDFILRIEDTDRERYVEGAVETIYRTLQTAGIEHDEGPDKDKGFGPYVQSERKGIYLEYAKMLVQKGGAYYCFCDKERLESLADENGIKRYDKHCLKLTAEEVAQKLESGLPYVIRQNIPQNGASEYEDMVFGKISVDYSELEDGILIKSDGMPTYNFANVVDDHLMQISHVIRGTEYLSSTPKYNLMYDAFGWERPKYMHLPPIMKDEHRKLSKRFGDANFEDFIQKGFLPEAIVNYIALLGWSPKDNKEKMTMSEMIEEFCVDGISKSGSIFDEVKMRWLNGEYIKQLSLEQFMSHATPYFESSLIAGKYDYEKLGKLLLTRIETFGDIPQKVNFLQEFGEYDCEMYFSKKMKVTKELALVILKEAIDVWGQLSDWTEDALKEKIAQMAESLSVKSGQVFLPIRLAITGVASTPGGATEMADILGKEETLKRLNFSLNLLQKNLEV
ncbi:MAG: glutamate--tRNA ligase [Clostridia bacterium]